MLIPTREQTDKKYGLIIQISWGFYSWYIQCQTTLILGNMWTWAFSYQTISILSTVYRKHCGNLEYCSNCFQMHGNNAFSWKEHSNCKSAINHTTFKIKIMKRILRVLWDILLLELRTNTIYCTSEPQTLTNVQELWYLISQYPDTSILAEKICLLTFIVSI